MKEQKHFCTTASDSELAILGNRKLPVFEMGLKCSCVTISSGLGGNCGGGVGNCKLLCCHVVGLHRHMSA